MMDDQKRGKVNEQKQKNLTKELAKELDAFDNMLSALVELLEEKGIITQEEWEQRIRTKIAKAGGLPKYRNIQFADE